MRIIWVFDDNNYDIKWKKHKRDSVKAIIFKDNKLAMIRSEKYGEYKFIGGGIDINETHIGALIREVKEETGLHIIPDSVAEYGKTLIIRRGVNESEIFEQDSFYYVCEVDMETCSSPSLEEGYEKDYGYMLVYVSLDEAIKANEKLLNIPMIPWVERDLAVLYELRVKNGAPKMIVKTAELGALQDYTFVVIFCRYQDKWLYCRAIERDSFETAGGHIESGETALEAAKRELFEETGAVDFDIEPVFDYSVQSSLECGAKCEAKSKTEHHADYKTGQVFLAHIHKLGELSGYEMAEVKLFEATPDKMRFPQILPVLYKKLQIWLNLHSAKDEIWDVYDSERNLCNPRKTKGLVTVMNKNEIISLSEQFAKNSPFNYIDKDTAINADCTGMQLFEAPIFAFGAVDDELYEKFKSPDVIGNQFIPPNEWLPNAKTVISFFFPYTAGIKSANSLNKKWPADEWLHGRYDGQLFIKELADNIVKSLTDAGYDSLAPSFDPRFKTGDSRTSEETAKDKFIANWSERHIAYACGLGTFGLSKGLITEKGTCGRFCSIVTTLDLEKDIRPYKEVYEYCTMCGECAKNCPVKAISTNTKDDTLCSNFLNATFRKHDPRYGCGKCQVAAPCESGVPAKGDC